ncbi:DUF1653 domain-containing protein [Patescibacteria group bacterium]|nr:DUF1653 domain-containing protein [Patescibacteria group bacterium]
MLLKRGAVYEHVKTGKRYKIIALAKDSSTLEELVVYEALYDNSVSNLWVRSKENFLGEAISPDGTMHSRFRLVE